jgi:L-fucose isomerase-like protein
LGQVSKSEDSIMTKKNQLIPRIAVVSLSSPLEIGADKAAAAAAETGAALEKRGCAVVFSGDVKSAAGAAELGRKLAGARPDAVVLAPVCWFEDYLALDLLEECGVPVLLWARPGMETGSLCGAQQLGCYLRYLEYPFHHVFGSPGDSDTAGEALVFLRACALKSRLRRSKIGVAGVHVNGMTHTAPFEFALKKSIGPRVVQLYLPDIIKSAENQDHDRAAAIWSDFKGRAGSCLVPDETGAESMRMFLALKDIVAAHDLDAVTVGCYPQLMGRVCLAASLLADEGVPFACEGDVNGAAGQLILTLLSGAPTHHTDWLDPLEDGTVALTHCGSGSLSLAESKDKICLSSVRLMGAGACALFPSKPGPVTMLSLIARDSGYQIAMLQGEAVRTEMVFPGNPVRVRFKKPFKEICREIFEHGVGHHWMIVYGDHSAELRMWSKLAGKTLTLAGL